MQHVRRRAGAEPARHVVGAQPRRRRARLAPAQRHLAHRGGRPAGARPRGQAARELVHVRQPEAAQPDAGEQRAHPVVVDQHDGCVARGDQFLVADDQLVAGHREAARHVRHHVASQVAQVERRAVAAGGVEQLRQLGGLDPVDAVVLGQARGAEFGELACRLRRFDPAPARTGLEVQSGQTPCERAPIEGDDLAESEVDQSPGDDQAARARAGAHHDHVGLGGHVQRVRDRFEPRQRDRAGNAALRVLGRAAHVAQRDAPAFLLPAPQRVHVDHRHAFQVADAAAEGLARHLGAGDHRQPRPAPRLETAVQRRHVAIAERGERRGGQRRPRVAHARGDLRAAVADDQRRGSIAHQRLDAELDAAARQDGGARNVATLGLDQVAHVEQQRRMLGRQRGDEFVDRDGARRHAQASIQRDGDSPVAAVGTAGGRVVVTSVSVDRRIAPRRCASRSDEPRPRAGGPAADGWQRDDAIDSCANPRNKHCKAAEAAMHDRERGLFGPV